MNRFNIKLAEKNVSITSKYDYAHKACEGYISESDVYEIASFVTEEELASEIDNSETVITKEYAEFICLYRKIAEELPKYNRVVMHGAAITYNGSGVLFAAPSGTGKSTHIRLWKSAFRDKVDIVNGDKPIIGIEENNIMVYGSPWAGKENWHKNRCAPLRAICILTRSPDNFIRKINPQECLPLLLKQIYLPKNTESLRLTLELFSQLVSGVPVYVLGCDISQEAALTAYNGIKESL